MIRSIQKIDDDIIAKKRRIEEILCNDPDIIEVLDNKDLDPSMPEEYLWENIFPFLRIPGTQDISKNFITFTLDDDGRTPNNPVNKKQYIQFVVFVHKNLVKTEYGIARHDILGYLIRDIFHLSNKLGAQMKLIFNHEGSTDNDYYTRTLRFELITDNSNKPFKTNAYERKSIVDRHDKVLQPERVGE